MAAVSGKNENLGGLTMLKFNGLMFAKNDKEFTGSLFAGKRTCHGFYRKIKGGFQLLNMKKELVAFVSLRGQGCVVDARRIGGKAHYSYGLSENVRQFLELSSSLVEQDQAIKSVEEK
jgi:hypothetical protein